MKTFTYKSLNSGYNYIEGTVEAETSQNAIAALKEETGLDAGTYILTSPDEQITFSISSSTQDADETGKLYSFGWKIRLVTLVVFPGGFFITTGLCFFLVKPEWLFGVIAGSSFLGFGIARMLIEDKMLESFVCPRCHTPNDDWQRDSKFRIYYKCRQCRTKWDIGYKSKPGRRRQIGCI